MIERTSLPFLSSIGSESIDLRKINTRTFEWISYSANTTSNGRRVMNTILTFALSQKCLFNEPFSGTNFLAETSSSTTIIDQILVANLWIQKWINWNIGQLIKNPYYASSPLQYNTVWNEAYA